MHLLPLKETRVSPAYAAGQNSVHEDTWGGGEDVICSLHSWKPSSN